MGIESIPKPKEEQIAELERQIKLKKTDLEGVKIQEQEFKNNVNVNFLELNQGVTSEIKKFYDNRKGEMDASVKNKH